eukprot:369841_1
MSRRNGIFHKLVFLLDLPLHQRSVHPAFGPILLKFLSSDHLCIINWSIQQILEHWRSSLKQEQPWLGLFDKCKRIINLDPTTTREMDAMVTIQREVQHLFGAIQDDYRRYLRQMRRKHKHERQQQKERLPSTPENMKESDESDESDDDDDDDNDKNEFGHGVRGRGRSRGGFGRGGRGRGRGRGGQFDDDDHKNEFGHGGQGGRSRDGFGRGGRGRGRGRGAQFDDEVDKDHTQSTKQKVMIRPDTLIPNTRRKIDMKLEYGMSKVDPTPYFHDLECWASQQWNLITRFVNSKSELWSERERTNLKIKAFNRVVFLIEEGKKPPCTPTTDDDDDEINIIDYWIHGYVFKKYGIYSSIDYASEQIMDVPAFTLDIRAMVDRLVDNRDDFSNAQTYVPPNPSAAAIRAQINENQNATHHSESRNHPNRCNADYAYSQQPIPQAPPSPLYNS